MNHLNAGRWMTCLFLSSVALCASMVGLSGCASTPSRDMVPADPATLRGEATPPPAFANLPPGSELTVRLVDTAYRTEPEGTLGQARVAAGTWPVKFELVYDKARLHPARVYSLEAKIGADGRALFEHAQYLPFSGKDEGMFKVPMRRAPE